MTASDALPPEPMNGTDAALWDIERDPLLRTTVVSVLMLDRVVDADRLIDVLDVAAQSIPRLRQRVKSPALGIGVPAWVAADEFDVLDHVRIVTTTNKPGRRRRLARSVLPSDVMDHVTEFAEEPFDRERPLWEAAYIGPLAGGRSALVVKMHHSLADGLGGVALLDTILDGSRTEPEETPAPRPDPVGGENGVDGLSGPPSKFAQISKLAQAGDRVGRIVLGATLHPRHTVESVVAASTSAARLMSPSGPALSPLFLDRSVARQPGVHTADFARMHDAATRHGCTVNHLFLAGVIGGVADFHRRADCAVDELRVTMPVSIRQRDSATAGNHWAPARLRVPAGIDDPVERMLAAREITTISREEPALSLGNQLAGAVHMLPSRLSSGIVASMMHGIDLTVTNVPGLADKRYLAGAEVERIFGFAPTGGAAMSVALLTHDGTACFGMLSDTKAVDDVGDLHRAVADGIDAVIEAAEAREPTVAASPDTVDPVVEISSDTVDDAADDEPGVERLTALDASFLHLETPATPMHLGAVFTLDGHELRAPDGRIPVAELRRHVSDRLERAPRLLRRLVDVPLGQIRPVWAPDPDFDIEHHVRFTSLDGSGTSADLAHRCAQINVVRLDRSRPLWELWIIDGLANGDVALLQKVHHALADGVGSVELATVLFDLEPHPPEPAGQHDAPPSHLPSRLGLLASGWSEQLGEPFGLLRAAAETITESPGRLVRGVQEIAGEVARLIGPDTLAHASPLNRPVGRRRAIASTSLSFAGVDEIRTAFGGSANDVALAVLAGGLAEWLTACSEEVTDLRAMCPVSVRPSGAKGGGGNHVGAMMITLPMTEPDPVRRLELIAERTEHAKRHDDGRNVASVLDAFDHLPDISGAIVRSVVANQPFANLVITNVPGPRSPLWFAGARARSIVPMVPLGPNLALGIALLSYVDDLVVGFHADPDHIDDLHGLAHAVEREFATLRELADSAVE